jgi:outer membrane protein OmpA-like peptidoglycan-associated protein
MRIDRIFLVLFFAFAFESANAARPAVMRKLERQAENHYLFSEYQDALPIFMKLFEADPSNARFCYRIGICYYYSPTSRPLSVPYFERALRLSGIDKTSDLYLHSGLAYLSVNRFSDAKACFQLFRSLGDVAYDPTVAQRMIEYCENGEAAQKNIHRLRIRNLGKNVNSAFPDYAPVLTSDESQLLFTSKRPGTTGGRRDEEGYYYEDIYQCKNLANKKWAEAGRYDTNFLAPKFGPFRFFFGRAENVSQLNTNDHDGSIAIAPEGNSLYIYRYNDIWEAAWNGTRWEKPKRLHQEVDSKSSVEPSLCISPNGQYMYFVSDRKGGLGGKDIWFCTKKTDGTWSKPENMGPQVNTAENEESPYVTKDGNTLYFSSEGHNSIGGYDVFSSKLGPDGNWLSPENLGMPINNGGDDVFYIPDQSGNMAYYSTLNRYGEGDLDLFSVSTYPEAHPMAKMRIPSSDQLPSGSKFTLSYVDENGAEKTVIAIAGDSVLYHFKPGTEAKISFEANGYQSVTEKIKFAPSEYNNYLQTMNPVAGTGINIDQNAFDIDYAVDSDTVFDLLADRNKARELYMQQLTNMNTVLTGWQKETYQISFIANGQTSDPIASNNENSSLINATELDPLKRTLAPVLFDFNESFLRNDMKTGLDEVCNMLKKDPSLQVRITGHADNRGSDKYNLQLSRRRAEAVRNYFVICGISASRITVYGEGEAAPAAPNQAGGTDNPTGRSQNRRAEIQLVR